MESEEFRNTLKDFMMISPEMGCPWLHHPMSPPTASSIAFAWPSPRLQPLATAFTSSIPNNAEPSKPFIIINVNSVPELTSYNYLTWKSKIETLLISYDVYSFVDGTASIPPKTMTKDHKTKPNPAYSTWYRQDKLIYVALVKTISESLWPLIDDSCSTAQELWNTLAQTNAAIPSQTRIEELNEKLRKTFKISCWVPITGYKQIIKDIVDELALLGHTLSLEDLTACILLHKSMSIDNIPYLLKDVTFTSCNIPNDEEPSKPFIIINVDSVPKLTSYNYLTWKSKIEALLISYDVYSFVDGTTSIPPKTITNDHETKPNPAYYTWYCQDKLIYGALADTLSEPMMPVIKYSCSTAQKAWNTIAQRYAAIPSQTRIEELNDKLRKTTKNFWVSITEYIQIIKDLVDELSLLGHSVSPEDVTACILDGLGKDSGFESVVDSVQKRDTPISLEDLHQELLNKELISQPKEDCHWFGEFLDFDNYSKREEENLDYIKLFKLFDINGDGLININDYKLMMSLWGIEIAEIEIHGKNSVDLSEFINLLSSLSFKIGEPLYHIFLYLLFNNHPFKQTLQEAHINKLIAKFRKNHWGKVKNLMNENKMKDYWMVFSLFDMNGDGLLTTYDFETLMLIWGLSPTDNFEDEYIDFWGFLNLVDDLDIHILEPLYHFAIFSLIEHHLNIALIPEDELWNFSAIIRKNFCGREECSLMEYKFRSCKFVFDLFDVDHDGLLTMNDYKFLKELWNLVDSTLDDQEMSIDFESFFQVFPSIDVYEVGPYYKRDRASKLVDFNTSSGSLPPQASSHFKYQVFRKKRSKEEGVENRHKHNIRMIYELNRLFSILDYDEDDKLDSWEVETLLRGCKLAELKVKQISYKVDVKWGGRIGFPDLLNLLRDLALNPLRIIENPPEIFKMLDRNQDGFLSASDLKRFVLITGHDISDEDIRGLILELDIEGSQDVLIPNMLELNTDKRFNLSQLLSKVDITTEEVADHKIEEEFISFWELDKGQTNEMEESDEE